MLVSYRKKCKCWFTISCVVVVAFMVAYWVYKFQVEDRDIGVVDYAPLKNAIEVQFPAVSVCFKNPFLLQKLREISSNITGQAYLQYLEGKLYDEMYEQINYSNVTVDLGKYFISGEAFRSSGKMITVTDSTRHVEVFSGFHRSQFLKCFDMKYNVEKEREIAAVVFRYNKTQLVANWQDLDDSSLIIYIVVHYPGQFFLGNDFTYYYFHRQAQILVNIKEFEILKRRNSQNRLCFEAKHSYDDAVIDELLLSNGCYAPYLKARKSYPKCDTKGKIKNSTVDTQTSRNLDMPKACQRISRIRPDMKEFRDQHRQKYGIENETWNVGVGFPEEVKIITQSKDVDVHSLIGNIGGYLGLFLGNKSVLDNFVR